jgi:hypothetical protein
MIAAALAAAEGVGGKETNETDDILLNNVNTDYNVVERNSDVSEF